MARVHILIIANYMSDPEHFLNDRTGNLGSTLSPSVLFRNHIFRLLPSLRGLDGFMN